MVSSCFLWHNFTSMIPCQQSADCFVVTLFTRYLHYRERAVICRRQQSRQIADRFQAAYRLQRLTHDITGAAKLQINSVGIHQGAN